MLVPNIYYNHMAKIFLFRHGETFDNKEKIFSGFRDTDLTPEGIKETQKIAQSLKDEKVSKAYASDQLRSKHTLDIVLEGHRGFERFEDPRIRERDYGNLTGKSKIETEKQFPDKYPLWHRSYDTPPPNGESIKDVEVRVLSFLNDIIPMLLKDDVVFISAHGNSIRPMRKYFEGLSNEEMATFEHTPGKIYSYEV